MSRRRRTGEPLEPLRDPLDPAQTVMDTEEIRERLALVGRLLLKRDGLELELKDALAKAKECRRKIRECNWDLRSATCAARRDVRRHVVEEKPNGEVTT